MQKRSQENEDLLSNPLAPLLEEENKGEDYREANSNQQNAAEVALPSNSAQEEQEEVKGMDEMGL